MNLATLITSIRGWTGYNDPDVHDDALITSWIRMAEERINSDLRIADMLQIDTGTIYTDRVVVPSDWLETDFIRWTDGKEIKYLTRPDFYKDNKPNNKYTSVGRFLIIGGTIDTIDGTTIELHYFGQVPVLMDEATWLSSSYPRLLISAVMSPASIHMQEAEKAIIWETNTDSIINKLNDNYLVSTPKSGTLIKRTKGM